MAAMVDGVFMQTDTMDRRQVSFIRLSMRAMLMLLSETVVVRRRL